jgi:hypothetical protein
MHQAHEPNKAPKRHLKKRLFEIALTLAALSCAALAAARITCSISFENPLQLVTSGAEEEALASIWRLDHGQTVYTDPHAIPFTASYFNWLFYASYGLGAKLALGTFHLGDAWLPTACRLLTLLLALAGIVLIYFLLRRHAGKRIPPLVAVTLAMLAFLNPLCGFWIITARPDIGAAVLELTGVACALRLAEDRRPRWIIGAALCFAAAWAFKQTSVAACAGIVLACVLPRGEFRRPEVDGYRAAGLLVAISAGLALLAGTPLGPVYRHELYLSQVNCGFNVEWAALHFGSAVMKMPFIAAALAGLLIMWRSIRADPAWRAVSLVLLVSFLGDFVEASKGGAGDYYFIPVGLWSVIWLALAFDRLGAPWQRALALPAWLQVGVALAVLTGHLGIVNPGDPAKRYAHLATFLATQPGPVLVRDPYGNLPWISPTAPHFVMGYANEGDWRAGVAFEAGGWRGLMQRGYFAVVVDRPLDPFPPELLTHYRPVRDEAGWNDFKRR